ncbi:MAG: BON domain-containing protein [Gemmataceae bacterium]
MTIRKVYPLAAALGVWVGAANAAEPAAPSAANQKLAKAVETRLISSHAVDGADITVQTDGGTVTVTGSVKDAAQKKTVLQEIRVVPGVKLVKDGITVGAITQAQSQVPANLPPMNTGVGPVMTQAPAAMPMGGGMAGPAVEPAPLGHPGMGPADGMAPPLPPYAWPTYAPYNNASRVAYPTAYPYNAFPFIGPYYPFPKVPLGWRSVTLSWEDGHWWYGRTSTSHDYWRVRFW